MESSEFRSKRAFEKRMSISVAPLPHKVLSPEEKIVIVLVGLPARGKTYISTRLSRYLNWIGINTRVFNVGQYRRQATTVKSHDFFDNDNAEATRLRNDAANSALHDLLDWLFHEDGEVGIFDATNSTRERRQWLVEECHSEPVQLIFLESVCNNPEIIESNITEVKLSNPDYEGVDAEAAVSDFKQRIQHYEQVYQTLDEDFDRQLSYIKIINMGERFIVNCISGAIATRIVYFIMCIRVTKRSIYICRHGENGMNLEHRIGKDSDLTERGMQFREALTKFMEQQHIPDLKIWTSHMQSSMQTAVGLKCLKLEHWKALNEIDTGEYEGLTYEQIARKYPEEFRKRDKDKYHYRYPRGESYQDLVARLEPVILELERQTNVLVICHQAVARCLLAYFEDKSKEELPYLRIPLHTVVKMTPAAYSCDREDIPLGVPCVDTHRDKPQDIQCNISLVAKQQKAKSAALMYQELQLKTKGRAISDCL